MAERKQKELAKGKYKGKNITFNRVWAKHRFTDDEVKKLLADETIHIEAKKKNGETFECDGKLQKQTFNGYEFWGFGMIQYPDKEKATGIFKGEKIEFNRVWGTHRFTDDEVKKLLADEEITFKAKTKNGVSEFECTGKLEKQSYEGHTFYGFKRTDEDDDQSDNSDESNKQPINEEKVPAQKVEEESTASTPDEVPDKSENDTDEDDESFSGDFDDDLFDLDDDFD